MSKVLKNIPVTFDIQSAGNVTTNDLYNSVSISELAITKMEVSGTLFNFGIQEVTIPQLLISYYNDKKELVYVDHHFIKEGVRIQRKQYFKYKLANLFKTTILKSSTENCFVNGLKSATLARVVIPKRNTKQEEAQLQKVDGHNAYSYIKVEVNNYIGNPR